MTRSCTVCFMSAVRAVAARCKLPFALHPGLSQDEVVRTKEITKKYAESDSMVPDSYPRDTTSFYPSFQKRLLTTSAV